MFGGHPVTNTTNRSSSEADGSDELALISSAERYQLWHNRLGHLGPEIMKRTMPKVDGLNMKQCDFEHGRKCVCSGCQVAKMA